MSRQTCVMHNQNTDECGPECDRLNDPREGTVTKAIRLNITDEDGVLLGTVELTDAELLVARTSPIGATTLVEQIAAEAGVHH